MNPHCRTAHRNKTGVLVRYSGQFIFSTIILLVLLIQGGCKVAISVPEGGIVRSVSGDHSCRSGEECEIDVNDLLFDEQFQAIPDAGWIFSGWKRQERGLCGGKTTSCHLFTSFFEGEPELTEILGTGETYYLKPVFSVDSLVSIDTADVVLCTGMSNAKQQCGHWKRHMGTERYQVINGALGGHDYYKLRRPGEADKYFARLDEFLARKGLTRADVDIVYNKNTLSYLQAPESVANPKPVDESEAYWAESMIWFQEEVERRFPNIKAGYHGIRSSGTWCDKSPRELAERSLSAILTAIPYSDKWHPGPDLSSPAIPYAREDFKEDGCHLTESGLEKTTEIIDAFF